LALARLAGALSRTGRIVRQYDVLISGEEALPRVIAECKPDLVGISLRNIDNVDSVTRACYLENHRRIVQAVRRHTKAPIVLGGSGFSIFPRALLDFLGADFGVVGPGETAIVALADALGTSAEIASIPRVLSRKGSPEPARTRVSAFPRAAHDPEIIRYYWEQAGMIGLQTKRGCPRKCTYCSYPNIEGSEVVWADPVELADEIERMYKDFGVTYFFAVDSVFNLESAKEAAFAEELIRRAWRKTTTICSRRSAVSNGFSRCSTSSRSSRTAPERRPSRGCERASRSAM
jgi:radical SAM superfamily enzyme YgiQ (UPF0313 family)